VKTAPTKEERGNFWQQISGKKSNKIKPTGSKPMPTKSKYGMEPNT
jgi:hypothetical protein